MKNKYYNNSSEYYKTGHDMALELFPEYDFMGILGRCGNPIWHNCNLDNLDIGFILAGTDAKKLVYCCFRKKF